MMIAMVNQKQIETLAEIAERLDAQGMADESQRLRGVLAEIAPLSGEVPSTAAARILDVTPRVVRNWVRGGILPGRRERTGRFYVNAEALRPALDMRRILPNPPVQPLTD